MCLVLQHKFYTVSDISKVAYLSTLLPLSSKCQIINWLLIFSNVQKLDNFEQCVWYCNINSTVVFSPFQRFTRAFFVAFFMMRIQFPFLLKSEPHFVMSISNWNTLFSTFCSKAYMIISLDAQLWKELESRVFQIEFYISKSYEQSLNEALINFPKV